jgi:hypothetical protein
MARRSNDVAAAVGAGALAGGGVALALAALFVLFGRPMQLDVNPAPPFAALVAGVAVYRRRRNRWRRPH